MFLLAATCSRVGRIRDRSRRGSDRLGNPLGPAYLPHPGCKRPPLSWFCTGLLPPQVKASGLLKGQNDKKLEGVTTFSVFPLPSSPTLRRCSRRLSKKGRGKVSLWQLGENQVQDERSERRRKGSCPLFASSRRVRAVVRAKVSGSQNGAAEITAVSLPRVQASSRRRFSFSPLPPCRGPPRSTPGRLRPFSGATPTPLRAASGPEMERWQRSELAEPELEPGGLAALGEGTGRPEQG